MMWVMVMAKMKTMKMIIGCSLTINAKSEQNHEMVISAFCAISIFSLRVGCFGASFFLDRRAASLHDQAVCGDVH